MPYEYFVKPLRVLDGDTAEFMVDLGFGVHKQETLRFLGINAPEVHSTNLTERMRADKARGYVAAVLVGVLNAPALATAVKVQTEKPYQTDKYGRWLGKVFYKLGTDAANAPWHCLNDELIAEGHAVSYDGGKRT